MCGITITSCSNSINQKTRIEASYLKNLIKNYLKKNNIKFIGGNANYLSSYFLSSKISAKLNKSIAFDTIENHKHIDMSAEPFLIMLLASIYDPSYLRDCCSELEKFIAHNNIPLVIIDDNQKKYFKNLNSFQKIIIPIIQKELNIIYYLKLFEKIYN